MTCISKKHSSKHNRRRPGKEYVTLRCFVGKDLGQGRFSGDGGGACDGGEAGMEDGGGVSAGGSCEDVHICDVEGGKFDLVDRL